MTPSRVTLLALQHSDSAFPSGGFAFSQGLEVLASDLSTFGPLSFGAFLDSQIRLRWALADRVALVRAFRKAGDLEEIIELDNEVEASTCVEGLRTGSRRNGAAFLTTHAKIKLPVAVSYRAKVYERAAHGHLSVVQGLIWSALGIDEPTAELMSGYLAASSLVTAAVRLGVVGAIEAQDHLAKVLPIIEQCCADRVPDDEPITTFTPLAEIAVSVHGHTGSRMFSN